MTPIFGSFEGYYPPLINKHPTKSIKSCKNPWVVKRDSVTSHHIACCLNIGKMVRSSIFLLSGSQLFDLSGCGPNIWWATQPIISCGQVGGCNNKFNLNYCVHNHLTRMTFLRTITMLYFFLSWDTDFMNHCRWTMSRGQEWWNAPASKESHGFVFIA